MPNERDLNDVNEFGQFWDALVSGRTAQPSDSLDSEVVRLARWMTAEREPGPIDHSHKARLWEELMQTHALHPMMKPLAGPSAKLNGRGEPFLVVAAPSAIQPKPRQWQRAVSWVGAAAILLALLGSAFFALRPDPRAIMPPIQSDATPEASPPADVPMYKGNPARTGVNPGPAPQGNPVILWTAQLGGEIHSYPAVVGDALYVGSDDGGLYALDRRTGSTIWRFDAGGPVNSSPAVVDGVVYAGSEGGTMFALDAATGAERWKLEGAVPFAGPAVENGVLYTGTADANLVALEASSGSEIWRSPLGDNAARSVAVADGKVFVSSADLVFHAIDATNGAELWTYAGGGRTPAFHDGVVYLNGFREDDTTFLAAIVAATGVELWRLDRPNAFAPVAVGPSGVFAPGFDGVVYALDRKTGEELWTFATNLEITAAPALVGNTLLVGSSDKFLYALDVASGALNWKIELDGAIDFGPAVTGSVAFVGTLGGTMYAIGGDGARALASPSAVLAESTPATQLTHAGNLEVALVWQSTSEISEMSASGIAVAPTGEVYAVDYENNRIGVFNSDGSFRTWWGEYGTGPSQFWFSRPEFAGGDLAIDREGNIYVFDTLNARVQKFSPSREFVAEWGGFGSDNGQFSEVFGTIDPERGLIYVADFGNPRVQVFDSVGTFLDKWGEPGRDDGQFSGPAGVAVDVQGNVYVAEELNKRVQKFSSAGRHLFTLGDADGSGLEAFASPFDIAVDPSGNLYVSDFDNNRITVFSQDGTWIGDIHDLGGASPLSLPAYLYFDQEGALYVTEDDGRILKLKVTIDPK